jgi:hypothetical protein
MLYNKPSKKPVTYNNKHFFLLQECSSAGGGLLTEKPEKMHVS